jgi:RTA1 like protein
LPPYIIQAILILIAPALLAATVYMVLGYVILAVDGENHSMIREKFLTKIFVLGDIFSFMVQSTGKVHATIHCSGHT